VSTEISVWIAAFFTLCILSFLYRDNPFFRFAESTFAGISLGYYIGNTFDQTFMPNLYDPLVAAATPAADRAWLIFAMLVGVLLYARYVKRLAGLSRWALAIYVGYSMGLQMMQKLQGDVQPQAADTIMSLGAGLSGPGEWIGNVVMVAGVLSVLVYFFFSAEHRGALGKFSRLGVWFLMISFGASFGYTIMGRVSILIGRVSYLLTDWLGIG
jgi:hypothetical protein